MNQMILKVENNTHYHYTTRITLESDKDISKSLSQYFGNKFTLTTQESAEGFKFEYSITPNYKSNDIQHNEDIYHIMGNFLERFKVLSSKSYSPINNISKNIRVIRFHNYWAANTAKFAAIATPLFLGISVGTSVGTLLFTGSSITFTAAVLPITSTALMTGGLATTVIATAATTLGIGAVAIAAVGIGALAVKGISLYIEKRKAKKLMNAQLNSSEIPPAPSLCPMEQAAQQEQLETAQQKQLVQKIMQKLDQQPDLSLDENTKNMVETILQKTLNDATNDNENDIVEKVIRKMMNQQGLTESDLEEEEQNQKSTTTVTTR